MKAKLSDHYRALLSPQQRRDARNIIRHMSARGHHGKTVTSAYASALSLSIDRGKVHHPSFDRAKKCAGPHDSIGETVCAAVFRGVLPIDQAQSSAAAQPEPDTTPEPQKAGRPDPEPEPQVEPEPEPEPKKEPVRPKARDIQDWTQWVYHVQDFMRRNIEPRTTPQDDAGTRAVKDGTAMIEQGIPVHACKDAFLINNDESVRRELGVSQMYDPAEFGGYDHDSGPVRHKAIGYILALIRAGVPVYMSGPAGSGKSTLGEHIAEALDRSYRSLSLTGGASPAWITGRVNPLEGFINSGFGKQYEEGGVYLLDEVSNGSPDLLTAMNNAIAGKIFENPTNGRDIRKHDEFVLLAADNTWGTGSNEGGFIRRPLDKAFLDRFRMGRVFVDHDRRITDAIAAAAIARVS